MRILVDGPAVARSPRMSEAALGLAARGHRVWWSGAVPSGAANVEIAPPALALGRVDAQLVLSAGPPAHAALLGWLSGAHALVADVDAARLRRWSVADRLGWNSLYSFALVNETEAAALQRDPGSLTLDRVALWAGEPLANTPASAPEALDVEILERACERALARHRGAAPRPAVFLDRDGTLIEETGYLSDPDAVRLLPGVPAGLRELQSAGFGLVVISNQAGVGRGYYPIGRVHHTMARLRELLRREGVELDAIYFCPHAPDAGCACRKPGTELVARAEEDLVVDVRRSAMVGDKRIDVETGRNAGMHAVMVRSGHGEEEVAALSEGDVAPDRIAADFAEAVRWIVEELPFAVDQRSTARSSR